MTTAEPRETSSIATNGETAITTWQDAQARLALVHTYWLATTEPDGRPHVMPLFAVCDGGVIFTTAGPTSRKARNLARDPRCVVTAAADGLDLVVEGTATLIRDTDSLRHVAQLYASKYGWEIRPIDGRYDADFGAPSAGSPPYELYEIRPSMAYGLATSEPYGATRWRW
jgi:hypothetical protein